LQFGMTLIAKNYFRFQPLGAKKRNGRQTKRSNDTQTTMKTMRFVPVILLAAAWVGCRQAPGVLSHGDEFEILVFKLFVHFLPHGQIEAARNMIYTAARMWEGTPRSGAAEYSLMAKLFAISTAEWMVNETIRILGSTALLEQYPLHRFARDIHVHSTHASLYNTAQAIGRAALQLQFDPTEQQ